MTGADYLDLYGLDEATAQARANALARAMGVRRAGGTVAALLGAMSGDAGMQGVGKAFAGDADQIEQGLMGVGQQRATMRQGRDRLAADQAQHAAELAFRQQQAAAEQGFKQRQLGLEAARIKIAQQQADTENWAAIADPVSGGVVAYNRKTGEIRPVTPPSQPGAGGLSLPPLKPAQVENDIQALGRDVEPIAKAKPDIDALKSATQRGDVKGFGPIEGYLPNLVTSAEGVGNRQAAGRLMAAIIQATSGQAASEKEVARLLEANGMGRTATDDQLRLGVAKLEEQYRSLLKGREAKYRPEVVDEYGRRGGFTSKSAGAGGSVTVMWKGKAKTIPAERLQEALAAGATEVK